MLLGTLGANLLGNLLANKELLELVLVVIWLSYKKGKGIVRAGYGKEWDF